MTIRMLSTLLMRAFTGFVALTLVLGQATSGLAASNCEVPSQSLTVQDLRNFRDQQFKGPLGKLRRAVDSFLHFGGRASYYGDEVGGTLGIKNWIDDFKEGVNTRAKEIAKKETGKVMEELPIHQRLEFTERAWKEADDAWTKRIFEIMKVSGDDEAKIQEEIFGLSKRQRKRMLKEEIKDARKRIKNELSQEEFVAFLMVHRSSSIGFDVDPVAGKIKDYLLDFGDIDGAVKKSKPNVSDTFDPLHLIFPHSTRAWRLEPKIKVPMGPAQSVNEFAERLVGLATAMDRSTRKPPGMLASAWKAVQGIAWIDENGNIKSESLNPFKTYYKDFAGKLRGELQIRTEFKKDLLARRRITPDMSEVAALRVEGMGAWLARKYSKIRGKKGPEYELEVEKAAVEAQIALETVFKRPVLKAAAGVITYLVYRNCKDSDVKECATTVIIPELALFELPYNLFKMKMMEREYKAKLDECVGNSDCKHALLYDEDAELFEETQKLIDHTADQMEKKSLEQVTKFVTVLGLLLNQEVKYSNEGLESLNAIGLQLQESAVTLVEACSTSGNCMEITKTINAVEQRLSRLSKLTNREYIKDIQKYVQTGEEQ